MLPLPWSRRTTGSPCEYQESRCGAGNCSASVGEDVRTRGFTLIELLVATALAMLVLLLAAQAFMRCMRINRVTMAKLDLAARGRLALDMLRRDLENAHPGAPLRFDNRDGQESLFFLTTVPSLDPDYDGDTNEDLDGNPDPWPYEGDQYKTDLIWVYYHLNDGIGGHPGQEYFRDPDSSPRWCLYRGIEAADPDDPTAMPGSNPATKQLATDLKTFGLSVYKPDGSAFASGEHTTHVVDPDGSDSGADRAARIGIELAPARWMGDNVASEYRFQEYSLETTVTLPGGW